MRYNIFFIPMVLNPMKPFGNKRFGEMSQQLQAPEKRQKRQLRQKRHGIFSRIPGPLLLLYRFRKTMGERGGPGNSSPFNNF